MSQDPNCERERSENEQVERDNEKQQLSLINQAVSRYLAQREHGFKELIHKLVQKGFTDTLVLQVVQEFANQNWQSDLRFASSMIKRRVDKGYGERYIMAECQHKGIDSALISQALEALQIDWYGVAYRCAERKFAMGAAPDPKTKMKRFRFLSQRGFSSEIVRTVLDDLTQD